MSIGPPTILALKNLTHILAIVYSLILVGAAITLVSCASPPEQAPAVESQAQIKKPSQGHVIESNAGGYLVRFKPRPDPLLVNELCDLEVQVMRPNGSVIETDKVVLFADAAMPHHGHGMNVVPQVTSEDGDVFLVDGMLFHMPGRWELYFDITEDDVTERAQCVVFFE